MLPLPSNFHVVAKTLKEYIIPFIALKQGSYEFDFVIGDTFFEGLDYSIIHSGDVKVDLILDKKETMMIGHYTINGTVSTNCDRCTDPVDVEVEGEYQLIYKFGTEPSDDETLVVIHPDSYELDVSSDIYELITVSLPSRSIHEDGECNEEMMDKLSEYLLNPEDEDEDDDDFDDEDCDDDDDLDSDDEEDEGDDDGDDDDDGDIDPRWNALKSLTAESSKKVN